MTVVKVRNHCSVVFDLKKHLEDYREHCGSSLHAASIKAI